MTVIVVRDDDHFQQELASSSANHVLVIDFTASWCGPCQRIAPVFERLSNTYSNGVFLKVDVEQCPETAHSYSVEAMPTFVFIKNRVVLTRIRGADPTSLENKVRELVGLTDGEGSGQSDSGVAGHIELNTFINKTGSECLNESDEHPLSGCLTSGSNTYLESDCDEQLIINLAFNQPLKLHSLKILAPKENGPKNMKLFINTHKTLDFDECNSMESIQKLEFNEQDLTKGIPISLRYVKFQNVQNLLIFVENNQSNTEISRIDYLSIIGSPVSATNMNDFKRIAGKKGESH
ncbi:thioredoxin-like protein 1 [Oppia nitens]|uniref:thioredoxin-like protein 1 n=1 Tax=Oppia nitens TaxID=1686743 RepID=UPI0023DC0B87|nr:thioredoxin-like protein 1 [Oppia nitens]